MLSSELDFCIETSDCSRGASTQVGAASSSAVMHCRFVSLLTAAGLCVLSSELDSQLVPGGQAGGTSLEPGDAQGSSHAADWLRSSL